MNLFREKNANTYFNEIIDTWDLHFRVHFINDLLQLESCGLQIPSPPKKKEKRSGGVAWLVEGIFAKTAQIFHETCIDPSILR